MGVFPIHKLIPNLQIEPIYAIVTITSKKSRFGAPNASLRIVNHFLHS